MTHWLIVESFENWRTDKANGFRSFGLPERKLAMARQIKAGDQLITYVSGRGGFSDVRRVIGGVSTKPKGSDDYDRAFSLTLPTEPLVVLEPERWIKAGDLHGELGLSSNPKAWPQFFRTSLRPLNESQASVLLSRMNSGEPPSA